MEKNVESELSEVERIKIDRAFDRLQRMNYYELLNLPRQADKAQIKRSYYAVSKEYHPDRYFRRNLGPYKDKLESIFGLLTKAYNTLTDDEARAEYDRSMIEASMAREPADHEIAIEVILTGSHDPGPSASSAGLDRPGVARAAAQSTTPSAGQRPLTPTGQPQRSMGGSEAGVRPVFMDRLQQQIMERMMKAREHLRAGKEAFEKGNYVQAVSSLQFALMFDGKNPEIRALLEHASGLMNESKADSHYQRGVQDEMMGNPESARSYFKRAVDAKPRKGHFYYKYAQVLSEEENGDKRQALEQFKLAVQYDPRNIEYLMALAKSYEDCGMPRNAARELEKVLAIDKTQDSAVKSLKRLKAVI